MHIVITIEDALVEKAVQLTGVTNISTLTKLGLKTLITRETNQRLINLGASEPQLEPVKRKRDSQYL